MKKSAHERLKVEIACFESARKDKRDDLCLLHLGRAHIISQSMNSFEHLSIHFIMFCYACRKRDPKEVLGQLLRLLVTLPGHLFGKVPLGNTGWTTMKLTDERPIPDDLKDLFS